MNLYSWVWKDYFRCFCFLFSSLEVCDNMCNLNTHIKKRDVIRLFAFSCAKECLRPICLRFFDNLKSSMSILTVDSRRKQDCIWVGSCRWHTYSGHDIISNLHHTWILSWIDDPRRKSNFNIFCWAIILGKATQGLFWKLRCVVKLDLSSAKKHINSWRFTRFFFK